MEEEPVTSSAAPEEPEQMETEQQEVAEVEEAQVEEPSEVPAPAVVAVEKENEVVKELEEMFKNRFTDDDPEFVEVMQREDPPPPIVTNFLDLRYQRDREEHSRHDRRDRRGERDDRNRSREDRYRGDHRRDRSRSPHRQNTPKMPNSYYFYYY